MVMVDDSSDLFAVFVAGARDARMEATIPISTEELGRVDDPLRVVGRVSLRLYERYGSHEWRDVDMPDAQRRWLAVEEFESEWANGGIAQFVINQGDGVEATLAWARQGYEMLSLSGMADLATRVLRVVESERGLRAELESLASATDRYIAYSARARVGDFDNEVVACEEARGEFVLAHPSLFVG